MTEKLILSDHNLGLTVTARPGPYGRWIVNFLRRSKTRKMLDQNAAWMVSGGWDRGRWRPIGSPLVPPVVLAVVEHWLNNHPLSVETK